MFKERLKITRNFILKEIIFPIAFFAVFIASIVLMGNKLPVFIIVFSWGVAVIVGLIVLIGISIFIYWLFIEPFKNKVTDD